MVNQTLQDLFSPFSLGTATLPNRFVFPPIKLGYGNADGTVTDRQVLFYRQIAKAGPGVIILEPVAVTPEGREHPKQLCVHLPGSVAELKKIVEPLHKEGRLACLHLNHAGAAANPKVIGTKPRGPSAMTCPTHGQESVPLSLEEIERIIAAFGSAARKALEAGFDLIEVQAGHGYLLSQFLNGKVNKRPDAYGQDRLLFPKKVLSVVKENAPGLPILMRISGNEMSLDFGIRHEDLLPLIRYAQDTGVAALHVGMGHSCFSPAWYFHHGKLPEAPQRDSWAWIRQQTSLPVLVAGRMGRRKKILETMESGLADLVALGRPLIADPHLLEKWKTNEEKGVTYCGYCLQGCLHRLRNGEPLGCNLNPEIGLPPLEKAAHPLKVLVAGGGPAGLSAAFYLAARGHGVTLAEKKDSLGGQFALAWKAPGKEAMRDGLKGLEEKVRESGAAIFLSRAVDAAFVGEIRPDLLVWATGALQYKAEIPGIANQYSMTAVEFLAGEKEVRGPRVLVIGAGRTGLEIAETLGKDDYEVVATKRTDPLGSMMEMISRNLVLTRIDQMPKVTLMPHTTVRNFFTSTVDIEQDGVRMSLEPFQTVILASGMVSAPKPGEDVKKAVAKTEIIGDATAVADIYSAVQAGYQLARKYA